MPARPIGRPCVCIRACSVSSLPQGNVHVTFSCVQAFSWGVHLPALEKGGDGHTVAMVGAWVVIIVGVFLTVMGLLNEVSL
jgi:hypothetical protein